MTKIEWCDEVINIMAGCTKISSACENCYAEKMAWRLKNMGVPIYQNVVDKHGWTGKLSIDWSQLDKPLKWKKPRRIFVGSMTDMFHEKVDVDSNFYDRIMQRIRFCSQHTFMMLTKRANKMEWVLRRLFNNDIPENLWVGVTVENQKAADERIPILLQIPATVRFVSVEPMLGPVDISKYIGYNPLYENKTQRERSLSRSRTRPIRNRLPGKDMESSGIAGEPLEQPQNNTIYQEASSRTRPGTILAGPQDGGEQSPTMPCPPAYMEALSRSNSRGSYGEPQEREKERQQAGKPGACDTVGTDFPCFQDGAEESGRRKKSGIKTIERADRGHTQDIRCWGNNPKEIGETVHGITPDDIGHSQGKTTKNTDGADSGLFENETTNRKVKEQEGAISLILCGAETGHKARPMNIEWARNLLSQCRSAGVPFFMKKIDAKGSPIPKDLMVREFPK